MPAGRGLSLEQKIVDRLTELGNTLGRHLDLLSHDTFQLSVDCRQRRARVRIGGGDPGLLSLQVDGEIQFDDLNADVHARVDLGFRGHMLRLELPRFRVSPAEYRGDYGVSVSVPVLTRSF